MAVLKSNQKQYRSSLLYCFFCILLTLTVTACSPAMPATPFIPPTNVVQQNSTPQVEISFTTPTPAEGLASETPQTSPFPSEIPVSSTPACFSSLRYLDDINYPDGTILSPGEVFEKQWQVENNGSCDWGADHRLRFVDGSPMGAPGESAIFPARTGSEAILSIQFTAPVEPGSYRSTWQAYDDLGQPFGDSMYVEIIVQNP